jgi:hypothetical protein
MLVGEANHPFDDIGVAAGAKVVELGCGPRDCLDPPAERVEPDRLVGLEPNENAVALAHRHVRERGLRNVLIGTTCIFGVIGCSECRQIWRVTGRCSSGHASRVGTPGVPVDAVGVGVLGVMWGEVLLGWCGFTLRGREGGGGAGPGRTGGDGCVFGRFGRTGSAGGAGHQ